MIKYIYSFVVIALLFVISTGSVANSKVVSFNTAKNKLYSKVYNNSGETLYCDCKWSNRKTDLNSCGLQSYFPKKQGKRAARTEAEHIIPASWMYKVNGKTRQCVIDAKKVNESPRKYCQKHDNNYKQAHNDLANLFPSVGQVNADRSNKPFVDKVKNKVKTYAQCDIQIGSRGMVPPSDRKGDIARVGFYMQRAYGISYSKRQLELFKKWDRQDPISKQEIAHNKRVVKAQGFGIQ